MRSASVGILVVVPLLAIACVPQIIYSPDPATTDAAAEAMRQFARQTSGARWTQQVLGF